MYENIQYFGSILVKGLVYNSECWLVVDEENTHEQ